MTRLQSQKKKRNPRPDRNRKIRRMRRWKNRRSMDELKKLALDIHRQLVWTDRSIPDPQMIPSVWPILPLMDERTTRSVRETIGKRGMIYEYGDKAMPRGINGYPMFFSMSVLSSGESSVVIEILRDLSRAEGKVLA